VDSPSDIDNCYKVDLVKESIEDNSLKEAPSITYEASIVHLFDVKVKKAQGNTNPLIEVIEPSPFSSSHHKL
ncbi:hypothetical protein PanWU01x14_193410, partial [Parasponia andersonii]